MKEVGDADYDIIYDGKENPNTRELKFTTFRDAPIQNKGYLIRVRAYNWRGVSPDTGVAL